MLKDTFNDPKELFEHLFRGNKETIDELLLGLNIVVSNKNIFDYIDSMINEEFISNYKVVKTLFQSILINNPYILTSISNLMDTDTGKILQDKKLTLEYEQYKLISKGAEEIIPENEINKEFDKIQEELKELEKDIVIEQEISKREIEIKKLNRKKKEIRL